MHGISALGIWNLFLSGNLGELVAHLGLTIVVACARSEIATALPVPRYQRRVNTSINKEPAGLLLGRE